MKADALRFVLAFALAVVASTSWAQPKPALVQDRDEPGRDPFQQVVSNGACGGVPTCTVLFPAVPAGKRLVVTQMTIETSVANIDTPIYIRVSDGHMGRASFTLTGPSAPKFATFPLLVFVNAGDVPTVYSFAFDTEFQGGFSVSLSGYFITL